VTKGESVTAVKDDDPVLLWERKMAQLIVRYQEEKVLYFVGCCVNVSADI